MPKGGLPEEISNKIRNGGVELQILIQDLKPGTRANEKASAIQCDLKASNIFHDNECSTPYATGRKCLVYTSLQCEHFALSWEMYPATTG
ncbi:8463_t:CDS:2 [Entrophospora sp. SA101]|nr:8463_t:CDS:2 [Entrophospora sp. SA101]